MMKPDRHGWALDSSGNPELWCFVGTIFFDCCCTADDCCNEYSENHSNKLLLLGIDSNGRVYIKHDFGQVVPLSFGSDGVHTEAWGGLEWISRDVFVIFKGKSYSDTIPQGHIKAFKIDEMNSTDYDDWKIRGLNDTECPDASPLWSRKLLKNGTNGNDPANHHMGWLAGFTSVPSFTPLSAGLQNNQAREANILAVTGKIPYTASSFNGHVAIYNLNTVPEYIHSTPTSSGYESSSAWQSESSMSAWATKVKGWGEPQQWGWVQQHDDCAAWCAVDAVDNGNKVDVDEGWCTVDSKGNFYYGTSQWLGAGKYDGYQHTPLQFWSEVCDPWCDDQGTNVVAWVSTVKVPASGTGLGTKLPMVFDRPNTQINGAIWTVPHSGSYDSGWHFGGPPLSGAGAFGNQGHGLGLNDGGIPYDSREFSGDWWDPTHPGADISFHGNYDQSHKLLSDSGCCDIYGESQGLLAKANGSGNISVTPEMSKDTIWLLVTPNSQWGQPETSAMRAGLWVVKDTGNQVMEVQSFFPCKNSGGNGWNSIDLVHDADHGPHDCGLCEGSSKPFCANRSCLNAGMSFRPNSYSSL